MNRPFRRTKLLANADGAISSVTSRSQSGQTMLELALLLPFLLLLLFGVIEMGRYMYISILVANAARAGAAYGATHPGDVFAAGYGGIATAADNDFISNGEGTSTTTKTKTGTVTTANLTVTATVSCGCDSSGTVTNYFNGASCQSLSQSTIDSDCANPGHWVQTVSVTASGTYNALFGYPFVPKSLHISRTAVMRVQE